MKLILLLIALSTTFALHAQSVISSGGQSATSNSLHASATIGEPIIGSSESNTGFGNQGFQQPHAGLVTGSIDIDRISYQVKISPNPSTDLIRIDIDKLSTAELQIQIYSNSGIKQSSTTLSIGKKSKVMDISKLINGSYFIILTQSDGAHASSFQFVKI